MSRTPTRGGSRGGDRFIPNRSTTDMEAASHYLLNSTAAAANSTSGMATNSFFSVSFLYKIINLPGGKINDPSLGKHYSILLFPTTPSSLSRSLLPELLRYMDTVRCGTLFVKVSARRQQLLMQTLIVRLLHTL